MNFSKIIFNTSILILIWFNVDHNFLKNVSDKANLNIDESNIDIVIPISIKSAKIYAKKINNNIERLTLINVNNGFPWILNSWAIIELNPVTIEFKSMITKISPKSINSLPNITGMNLLPIRYINGDIKKYNNIINKKS